MKSAVGETTVDLYKCFERSEHISVDDVLNKVTQEVVELIWAIESNKKHDIYSEAGDVLINIISIAQELGFDISELLSTQAGEKQNMISLLWAWNEQIQALRWRYSRKQWSFEELELLTKSFISTILNYTDPDRDVTEKLKDNLYRLIERKNMYKQNINVKDYIAEYPDFPKKGINFKDISPILTSPDAMRFVCHEMAEKCRWADKIVALDARGFIFAPIISEILGIPWVMCRKKWKLPWETLTQSYDLEYGSATIELQVWAVNQWEKIAIIDDLLATGGTAMATVNLIKKLWWNIHHVAFVIALQEEFLLSQDHRQELQLYPHSSVVSYDS